MYYCDLSVGAVVCNVCAGAWLFVICVFVCVIIHICVYIYFLFVCVHVFVYVLLSRDVCMLRFACEYNVTV